ncbi:MAG: PQQ-binding-like beta-propeller repeat protein [Chloroflexaceae bacterium]|nr:PQQ-binding-like beta-propeller repeat protein [Chloroflexaceae bacterium]
MGLIKKVGARNGSFALPEEESTRNLPGQSPAARRGTGSTQTLHAGTVLQGRYVVEGPLGIGGMSVVYKGRDLRFKDVNRLCAIKEMAQSAPDSNTRLLNLKNFEREAGLLATLHHPAIPKVYDFFEEQGRIYLILELIPGKDLETVLDEAVQPLEERQVRNWAVQMCDVLHYLHTHKPETIVFRDMKPSNVMVTRDDRIVLIDFGIARNLNRTDRKGTMIGTEGYSPPEQYRGTAEAQSDLYALGATLHHLLTNSDPRLETPFTFQERPIRTLNPAVSPEMEAIINRALEYDMATRWSSADEMRQALARLGGGSATASGAAGATASAPEAVLPAATASSETTEVVWSFKAEEELRSSPLLSNGMVFIGSYDSNLYALDAGRGEFRWKYATQGGISSSPSMWQDLVFCGSEDGKLYAMEWRRGAVRWAFQTDKPIRSSPRVDDRVVFVGSDDMHVYALDGLRGSVIWKFRTWQPIRSSACINGDVIYIGGNDGHIYALDARSGGAKWKQRTQQEIVSSPTFHEGLVFVGSMDSHLYALDAEGGWPVWKARTGAYVNSSPCMAGKRVIVGSGDGCVYAFETKNGRVAWKFETGSKIVASPRAANGRVYVGAVNGYIYCLNADNGSLIWRHKTGGMVVSSAAVGDGIIYVGSGDQTLYALKA